MQSTVISWLASCDRETNIQQYAHEQTATKTSIVCQSHLQIWCMHACIYVHLCFLVWCYVLLDPAFGCRNKINIVFKWGHNSILRDVAKSQQRRAEETQDWLQFRRSDSVRMYLKERMINRTCQIAKCIWWIWWSPFASQACSGIQSTPRDSTLPRLHNKFGERAFSCASPSEWNALPQDSCNMIESADLRKEMNTHYFTTALNVQWLLIFFCFSWLLECSAMFISVIRVL